MKKAGIMSIFVFLTGLFAGLFFSTDLSPENHDQLSSLLLSGVSSSESFIKCLTASIMANFPLALLMLPTLFSKLLCPLPFFLLFYKSFSLGFCSGLVHMSSAGSAVLISLLKFLPQNLFFIPAFLLLAAVSFSISLSAPSKTNRPSRQRESLKKIVFLVSVLLLAGCITEATCRLIAL